LARRPTASPRWIDDPSLSTRRPVKKVDALAAGDAARLRELIVEMDGLPCIAGAVSGAAHGLTPSAASSLAQRRIEAGARSSLEGGARWPKALGLLIARNPHEDFIWSA
jgi:hypothetical protein